MTKREAAIVTAYTGISIGDFSVLHAYIEEKFGHPVWTHEMGSQAFGDKLRELSREDFLAIEITD